jgi:hypothetical protein
MKDATEEFEVESLQVTRVPGVLEAVLYHKACKSHVAPGVELVVGYAFECQGCMPRRRFVVAQVLPLKIVEPEVAEEVAELARRLRDSEEAGGARRDDR